MSMVGFPLLLIPLAIVNIIAFLMPGVSFTDPIVSVTLMSQVQWKVTFGDAVLAFSILLLWFEVIKGARPGGKYFTDHFLALVAFGGAVAEFLLLPKFANSVFFLLTVLMLVDFLAGVSLRLRRENRRPATVKAVATKSQPVSPPPQPVSAPQPPQPPQSVAPPQPHPADSVLPPPMATIEPARSTSSGLSSDAAPAVTAPELQPGTSPSTDHR